MNKKLLLFSSLMIVVIGLMAQQVKVDVEYKMRKHPAFKFKVGRPMAMTLTINDQVYEITSVSKDLKKWEINNDGSFSEATFYSDEEKGIWWEIANPDVTTTVLLSTDPTDTNDPREFVITSTADRGKYMVFNEEPDCNSEFTLIEPTDSPTLLTGVMRTYGSLRSNGPCEKGKWKVKLDHEPLDHVLLGWIFASVQSMNVRFMEE